MRFSLSKYLFFILIVFCSLNNLYAQGTGDPGIGIIDFRTRENYFDINEASLGFLYSLSSDEMRPFTFASKHSSSLMFGYTKSLNERLIVDSKFLISYITGPLANNLNFSDIITSVNYKIFRSENERFNLMITSGIKVPLTQAMDQAGAIPLPMTYQTSLGTFDLFSALGISYRGGEMIIGAQTPVLSINRNQFLGYGPPLEKYLPSFHLKRGSDLFSRFSWRFYLFKDSFWIMPLGQLFIRINPDKYKNPFINEYIQNDLSQFFPTIQLNISMGVNLNDRFSISLHGGVSDDDSRMDGLNRPIFGRLIASLKL